MRRGYLHILFAAGFAIEAFAGAAAGSSSDGIVAIADFDSAACTAQGGLFHVDGGRPDVVTDRLVRVSGGSDSWAWRIELTAGAPRERVGGIIPLFDNVPHAGGVELLDARTARFIQLRLRGSLGNRALRVEIVPGLVTAPARWGAVAGELSADGLEEKTWRSVSFPLAADGLDLSQLGAVRLMFEGDGAAWIEVDSIRLSSEEAPIGSTVRRAKPRPLRRAMWVWKTNEILPDADKQHELLAFCRQHGVTDLYVQIPYNYDGGAVKAEWVDEQRAFNAAAYRAGITIHALDGAPDFIFERNHPRMFALVDWLRRFNAESKVESRYPAIHLDNEPYVLPGWRDDAKRPGIIRDYLSLNRELRARTRDAGITFGVDIPFWWDVLGDGGKPAFVARKPGGEEPLLEALFPLVDNVGIMSYRERATGPNGVIGACMTEFALAERFGVDVFASVELGTGPDVEKGITFGVYPMDYFRGQLVTMAQALSHTTGCAGIAIHYYGEYRALEESP